MTTDVSEVRENAPLPMMNTELGSAHDLSEVHPANASRPITVTDFEMTTLAREVQ